jgi:hypothetical protein
MRFIVLGLLFMLITCTVVYAHQYTMATQATYHNSHANLVSKPLSILDSVALTTSERQQFMSDSIATQFIMPDSNRVDQFAAYLQRNLLYKGHTFLDIPFKPRKNSGYGRSRKSRDPWIIVIITGLLLYTALLNFSLGSDVKNVFKTLYGKRSSQFDKEDKRIHLSAFVGLFLLFGLTFGLFLYQLSAYKNVYYSIGGLQLFAWLSLVILSLSAFKFLILKAIGFLFAIDKVIGEYITALYLSYFNIAFSFLPVVICFSLLSAQFLPYLLVVALLLVAVIFIWIYLRSSVNIISNFRFHKFYLFIYLCALEICPILILVKVLNL